MPTLLDDDSEDREILCLALDRFSQSRVLAQLRELDVTVQQLYRAAKDPNTRRVCLQARGLAVWLRGWVMGALPPAGFIEDEIRRG